MSLPEPTQAASVFRRRQQALAASLGEAYALLPAGGFRPRNYEDNVVPYRADSHFLYLTGLALPNAYVLCGPEGSELFSEGHGPQDALWHGEGASDESIAARTGVDRVRRLEELPERLESLRDRVGTLPSADPRTRLSQGRTLGRDWSESRAPELKGRDAEVADALIALRLIHDEGAIAQLERAAAATRAAHAAGMAATRPGRWEYEIKGAMEAALAQRGMTTSYNPIVTVHGHVLHNNDYHHPLEDGDLLLADVGAECEGWAGDVTRTWPVNGRFSATQRALYEIVLQAEKDAIEMVRPGQRYRDAHLRAALTLTEGLISEGVLRGDPQSLVERGAHALLFPHGVGHLIGLDVHDMEDLGDRAGYAPGRTRSDQFGLCYLRLDRDLEAGMAVTIEPGIYRVPAILADPGIAGPFVQDGTLNLEALEKFKDVRGIRIEDDVLCTSEGPRVLTESIPREVEAVEAAVGAG